MINTLTAITSEVDDKQTALTEIAEQIDADNNLLKNSAGIITCYSEYIDEEIVEAICDEFDFPIVGVTTIANSARSDLGETLLTFMVLTSDDVEFSIGLSDPIVSDDINAIDKGYKEAMKGYTDKPALILTFAPLSQIVGGDFMVESLDKVSSGVPVFGTVTVDHNTDYSTAAVVYGKTTYKDRMAILLLHGNIKPKFVVASISRDIIMRDKDVVTASKGNQLQTVNGMSVVDYLINLGMEKNEDGKIDDINTIPFVVDYGDGSTPVIRVLFALTDEGYAVCGGDIPVGTTLSIGSIDNNEVVKTTSEAINLLNDYSDCNGAIIFSCIGRYFALGYDPHAEMELIKKNIPENLVYAITYSGGEICPVYDVNGKLYNRFHNDTFVACLL